jgi:hypothetical protein
MDAAMTETRDDEMAQVPEEFGAGLERRGVGVEDGVVHRPAGRWTTSVHHLLRWLRSEGYALAPEPLGIADGSERLRYLPGRDQGFPFIDDLQSDRGAWQCGAFVKQLTELLARYPAPPESVWQCVEGGPGLEQQMQHGDLGPWNLLWATDGPQVCGVIDWDLAEPGDPAYDIGFLAWFVIPMMGEERAGQRGFAPDPDRSERLIAFSDGVGLPPMEVLAAVGATQREFERRIVDRGAEGPTDLIWTKLHALGIHEAVRSDMAFTRAWTAAFHRGDGAAQQASR